LGVKPGFGGGPNLWVMGLYGLREVWVTMRGFDCTVYGPTHPVNVSVERGDGVKYFPPCRIQDCSSLVRYCTRLGAELWSWSRSKPADGPHGPQETVLIYLIDR